MTVMKIIQRNLTTLAFLVSLILLVRETSNAQASNIHQRQQVMWEACSSAQPSREAVVSIARSDISVFPNPTPGPATIRFSSGMNGTAGITVKNSGGATILYIAAPVIVGTNLVPVDLTHFGIGNYTIIVAGSGVNGKVVLVVK